MTSFNTTELLAAIEARQFLPSKPMREIRVIDLDRNPRIIANRKYNGNFAIVSRETNTIRVFTASGIYLTTVGGTKYWEEGLWYHALINLPPGSVLLGEIFIPSTKIEDLGAFQIWYTWHRNGKADEEPKKAAFRCFDLLTLQNRSLNTLPYEERYNLIPKEIRAETVPYTSLSQAAEAIQLAASQGIEGFVFWNAKAPSFCKVSGQNKARGGAWKVKPLFKEAFKLLRLVNLDPACLVVELGNTGKKFACGSGLTLEQRRELVDRFQLGQNLQIAVSHFGYDETGRPEIPVMENWAIF